MKSGHLAVVALSCSALLSAAPASARSPIADCLDAMAAGDRTAIEEAAERIERRNDWVAGIPQAEKCLSEARGELMRYDHSSASFLPVAEYEELVRSRDLARQVAQDRQARDDEIATRLRVEQASRREGVALRTLDACNELYRRDWVSALTSPICQPMFMETGLPD